METYNIIATKAKARGNQKYCYLVGIWPTHSLESLEVQLKGWMTKHQSELETWTCFTIYRKRGKRGKPFKVKVIEANDGEHMLH